MTDSRSQPTPEPVRRTATPWAYRPALHDDWGWIRGPQPDNGEIAPLVACARSGNWDDTATHDAHRAAGTDPYGANAAFIVEAVNSHASLKARAEQAERSVDVLESNARVQAKLLADTGRHAEELEAALREFVAAYKLQDCDNYTEELARASGEAEMSTMIEVVAKVCGLPRIVPPNPETEGYHWVRRFRGGPAIPLHWNPTWWHNADRGWGVWGQPGRESEWEYLGPCPLPDDAPQPGGVARAPINHSE